MNPTYLRSSAQTSRRAFTLIEVMISIAIALVLILGISQIFSMAQRTTGAGTQVLAATEINRAIQQTFLNDVRSIANGTDSPGIVIVSYPQAAFRTPLDQQQDRDQLPQTFNNPVNAAASVTEKTWVVDDRIHRTDVLCFFARGQFARRTGNRPYTSNPTPSLISTLTTGEAFIWYGHLGLPDDTSLKTWNYATPQSSTYYDPGTGTSQTNTNNFFASDWILGRQVILLADAPIEPHITGTSASPPVDPLSMYAAQEPDPSGRQRIYPSRYDLADTSIPTYHNFWGTVPTWWQGLSGVLTSTGGTPTVTTQRRYCANPFIRKPAPALNPSQRTQALSAALAQSAPIFVRGCTQFIVEFAGDYLDQSGATPAAGQDGQIDYIVDPATGAHQIRWYGFPRDTTGTGVIDVNHGVLPLGAVLNFNNPTPVAFERATPPTSKAGSPAMIWTTNPPAKNKGWTANNSSSNGLPSVYAQPYVCAWGADTDALNIPRPKMLRITVAVDDPTGHLNTQQVYEYVMNLP